MQVSQALRVAAGRLRVVVDVSMPVADRPLRSALPGDRRIGELVVHVKLRGQLPLSTIFSPSHTCDVQRDGDKAASVSFEQRDARPERDFQLYYQRQDAQFGLVVLTHRVAGEPGYFMLRLAPRVEQGAAVMPKDIAFVLDTSGSISGGKLDQVKRAMKACLDGLSPADRFAVFTFSTDVRGFREGLVAATPELRAAAGKYVDDLQHSGGTNIHAALKAALAANPGDAERPYLVVFMTDGQPTVGDARPSGTSVRYFAPVDGSGEVLPAVFTQGEDSTLGSFTTAGDGALRCLPRDGALQSFPADAPQLFADPACSQRLYRPRSKAARCASPPVALASHGCRAHVHQVTLHDLAAPIFTSESRTCQAASPESLARLSGPSFGLCAASVSPRQIRAERQVTAVHRVGYRHLGLVYDDAAAPRARARGHGVLHAPRGAPHGLPPPRARRRVSSFAPDVIRRAARPHDPCRSWRRRSRRGGRRSRSSRPRPPR